jgi:hypothetical protein
MNGTIFIFQNRLKNNQFLALGVDSVALHHTLVWETLKAVSLFLEVTISLSVV